MKTKFIILAILIFFLANNAISKTFEDHVKELYPKAKELIEQHYPGPIAAELTEVVVLRQGLEDRLNRSRKLSINGMGVGGRNKEIFDSIELPANIILSKIEAHDGMLSYQLKGPGAVFIGILAIAKWIDKHIQELPFISEKDKLMWEYSKRLSYLLTTSFRDKSHSEKFNANTEQRTCLIDRLNSMYGPGENSLKDIRKRLKPIFKQLSE